MGGCFVGFAVQLGTVRFLGTFPADPADVPRGVMADLARQRGIADTSVLERHAAGRDAPAPRRRAPPSLRLPRLPQGTEAATLSRWLANRPWVRAERPGVFFDRAAARLVERKVPLPVVSALRAR